MKRSFVPAALLLATTFALVPANAAFAAAPNLVKNGSFESPKVTAVSNVKHYTVGTSPIGHCSSTGNAINCWRLSTGEVVLTKAPVFAPKIGLQTLELYTGSKQGAIGQSIPTVTPGVEYRLVFWLSSDPAANDNLGVTVFMYNVDGQGNTLPGGVSQSFSYFDPTHTAANMKFQKESMTYTSLSSEMRIAIVENGFLGTTSVGPVIDAVRMTAT